MPQWKCHCGEVGNVFPQMEVLSHRNKAENYEPERQSLLFKMTYWVVVEMGMWSASFHPKSPPCLGPCFFQHFFFLPTFLNEQWMRAGGNATERALMSSPVFLVCPALCVQLLPAWFYLTASEAFEHREPKLSSLLSSQLSTLLLRFLFQQMVYLSIYLSIIYLSLSERKTEIVRESTSR